MKVLVTGATGFIGKNLLAQLRTRPDIHVFEYSRESAPSVLDGMAGSCDCVIHLAGVNRPQSPDEYASGNTGFTDILLKKLEQQHNTCPVIFTSSIQAGLDIPYGLSKKACEDMILKYGKRAGAKIIIYRLPNVFGKWCRPYYNSAVATFCYQITRGMPVRVDDRRTIVSLAYIDDVVAALVGALDGGEPQSGGFCTLPVVYTKTLGEITDLLYGFKALRETLGVPDMADDFQRKLFSTYQSYVPPDELKYPLFMNSDHRGFFTEIIRTPERGQFSVTVTKPGITRGGHWHQSKNEKFLVVSGEGRLTLHPIGSSDMTVYDMSGRRMEITEVPPGFVHSIENTGTTDLVTVIWSNEAYDPASPDTFPS